MQLSDLGIYTGGKKHAHVMICTVMFIAAFFKIAPTGNNSNVYQQVNG